jgi:hypothetical protein
VVSPDEPMAPNSCWSRTAIPLSGGSSGRCWRRASRGPRSPSTMCTQSTRGSAPWG